MSDSRGSSTLAALTGFLLGSVFGMILGLLVAPQSGRETRNQIKQRTDDVIDKTKGAYADQRDRVQKAFDAGREVAGDRVSDLRGKIGDATEKLKEQVEAATDFAKEKAGRSDKTQTEEKVTKKD
ncbi:MAG: YtxH domain-containing protein [Terriglobia bacterium]